MLRKFLEKIHTQVFNLNYVRDSVTKTGVPILVTSLTLTGLILGMRHWGFLQGAELAAYDRFIQSQPDRGKDDRFLIVGIDEIDLQTLQEWPISDRTLATALKKLNALKPRVIGIDIFRDIPIEPGRAELLKQLKTSDRTIIVCKVNSARELGAPPPPGIPEEKVGVADLVIDPGGILRRSLLMLSPPANTGLIIKKHLCNNPDTTLQSLSFNAVLRYLKAEKIEPGFTDAGELKLGSVTVPRFTPNTGAYRGADDGGYQLLLRYRSENNAAAQVRLTDVLQGKVAPELVRDRIVLIGYTTPQAKDDFYTPYSANKSDSQKMPGVVVHAQSASQLLDAVLNRRPLIWVWSWSTEVIWIFAWSLLGGILAWYLRHPLAFGIMVIVASSTAYVISLLIFLQGGWIPVVPAIAGFVSTAVGVVLFDRFNNSTYGQNVYRKVKTFLKMEVEIDEEKLHQQVSEITETDYFRDLQDTVKTLREQKTSEITPPAASTFKSPVHKSVSENKAIPDAKELAEQTNFFIPKSTLQANTQDADDYELAFIQELNRESQQLRIDTPTTDADDYELDFIQALQQESKQLKEGSPSSVPVVEDDLSPTLQKFSLLEQFTPDESTDADLDYLDFLQEESQRLKDRNTNQPPHES